MSVNPPEALALSFGDIESSIAAVLDKVIATIEAVEANPFVKWLLPAQYKSSLDELLRILEAADALLHKTP